MNYPEPKNIRKATSDDFQQIYLWLEMQEKARIKDNFFCNIRTIESSLNDEKNGLIVYVCEETNNPVAFQLGGLITPGIIQVRKDRQNQGIGKKLVEYCIQKANEDNEPVLWIECTPESSIPFWKMMGFIMYSDPENYYKRYAYKILNHNNLTPPGRNIDIVMSIYPQQVLYKPLTDPFKIFKPNAVLGEDEKIYLEERVIIPNTIYGPQFEINGITVKDVVLKIEIGGEVKYFGKAKYPNAGEMGVIQASNCFYIDMLSFCFVEDAIEDSFE